jgi:hypothetical protein
LRSLRLSLDGNVEAVASQLVQLPKLERLSITCVAVPERAESLRLAELPQLRRLDLLSPGTGESGRVDDLARRLQELLGDRVVIKAQ